MALAGPIRAVLHVTTTAADTDFAFDLYHVKAGPQASATLLARGILRLSHVFDGFEPERVVRLELGGASIGTDLDRGDRLRLRIGASLFPRLARNLNTREARATRTKPVVAVNTVFHGGRYASHVEIPLWPDLAEEIAFSQEPR